MVQMNGKILPRSISPPNSKWGWGGGGLGASVTNGMKPYRIWETLGSNLKIYPYNLCNHHDESTCFLVDLTRQYHLNCRNVSYK